MRADSRPISPTPKGHRVATPIGNFWVRDRATGKELLHQLGGTFLEDGALVVLPRRRSPAKSRLRTMLSRTLGR